MNKVVEIKMSGWTSTPRLPFVISGNALCLPVPPYSTILGIIGCCIGRTVLPGEVKVGYRYSYDTTATDLETRIRLKSENHKIKPHDKGSDAYKREFHVNPTLTIWIDRIDWYKYFDEPIGTPTLGRSQDLLKIDSVTIKDVERVDSANLSGCMVPFEKVSSVPGQLIRLAEAYVDNDDIGKGRHPNRTMMFLILNPGNEVNVKIDSLYQTIEDSPIRFYLYSFYEE